MHSYNRSDSTHAHDVFWFTPQADQPTGSTASSSQTEFSITDLAKEFGLTHRALRFYEARGLIAPQRAGRRRIFSRADRERLALIVRGKKLGFTLTEIHNMVEAQSGHGSENALKLTAEKCLEQIAFFERQMREAGEALAELRRIHLSLCVQAGQRAPKDA